MACFLAVHPLCGLTCRQAKVEDCSEDESLCELIEGGARCTLSSYDGDICAKFPCDECSGDPGSFTCAGKGVMACAKTSVSPNMCNSGPCSCTEACIYTEIETCSGACSEENGAHCVP